MNEIEQYLIDDGISVIQFNHESHHNPFNQAMTYKVINLLKEAENNEEIKAVILYGGVNRSFSAGGDFNEVKNFVGGDEVDEWIERVVKLYTTVLNLTKPTIAAIDKFAIGIGFQLAITCDWRLSTPNSIFVLPELQKGISCTLGAIMLEVFIGHANMKHIVYGCQEVFAKEAYDLKIVNQIVEEDVLLQSACIAANKIINYPQIPFKNTKKVINNSLLNALINSIEISQKAHRESFSAKSAQKHFKEILREKYYK